MSVRRAELIHIEGADNFFGSLSEKVAALEMLRPPHPLSSKIAVTNLKRYIPEDKFQIKLYELIMDETKNVFSNFVDQNAFSLRTPFTDDELAIRILKYEKSLKSCFNLSQPELIGANKTNIMFG